MKKLVMFLAVAGIFASCKPEAIETAFEVGPAEATITVSVIDINTAQPAEGYTLTATAGTVNGNVVTLTGSKALAETKVAISAEYEGETYGPVNVVVNALRAGGKASYGTTIIVGVPDGDKKITTAYDYSSMEVKYAESYMTPDETGHYGHSVDHDYTHDGITNWVQNLTEFMLTLTVDYTEYFGVCTSGTPDYVDPYYENTVDSYADLIGDTYYGVPAKYEYAVSAWSYYTVRQTLYFYNYSLNVLADDVVVGVIPITEVATELEYLEIANPYGHGHYEHGHGLHGSDANAGGGIIFGE